MGAFIDEIREHIGDEGVLGSSTRRCVINISRLVRCSELRHTPTHCGTLLGQDTASQTNRPSLATSFLLPLGFYGTKLEHVGSEPICQNTRSVRHEGELPGKLVKKCSVSRWKCCGLL